MRLLKSHNIQLSVSFHSCSRFKTHVYLLLVSKSICLTFGHISHQVLDALSANGKLSELSDVTSKIFAVVAAFVSRLRCIRESRALTKPDVCDRMAERSQQTQRQEGITYRPHLLSKERRTGFSSESQPIVEREEQSNKKKETEEQKDARRAGKRE